MYKPIPNTHVEVNELGQFRSVDHTQILSSGYEKQFYGQPLKVSSGDYPKIKIKRGERWCTYRAHRLVWEAFNGPLSVGDRIIFKNADRTNIALNNLELKQSNVEESDDQLLLRLQSLGMSYADLAKKFDSNEVDIASRCEVLRSK